METRYYYTSPMNDHTRTLFLSRMSEVKGDYFAPLKEPEKSGRFHVLDATVSLNVTPRIAISIAAPTKRQILDAKSHVEQQIGIKLAEKLF